MATPTQAEMIKAVRSHAEENYEKDGWDFLVECWSDEEIAEAIEGARSINGAIRKAKNAVGGLDERRTEVRAEIW